MSFTTASYSPLKSQRLFSYGSQMGGGSSSASVHAGAGGSGSRISVSRVSTVSSGFGGGSGFGAGSGFSGGSGFGGGSGFSGGLGFSGGSGAVTSSMSLLGSGQNEKETMIDLNDRLASYLDRVRSLESANQTLELQIRQHLEKKGPTKDWSPYFKTLEELRKQVFDRTLDNSQLVLQIDNARLAADDFRVKFESELAIRLSVETDINGLRKVIDDTNVSRLNLENEIESLKEELIFLKKTHEDDVHGLQAQIAGSAVTVEVDAPNTQDLGKIMTEIRSQYDTLAQKNREDAEKWYQAKVEEHTVQVTQDSEALRSSKTTVTELRRTMQSLEIELETLRNQKHNLEGSLHDTESRYAMELEMLSAQVQAFEGELTQVRNDCQRQQQEYQALLNTKLRLESEIQTYRRLLDGDDFSLQDALSAVSASPSQQQIKKVITTTQKIIDGKVISESNDTQVLKS